MGEMGEMGSRTGRGQRSQDAVNGGVGGPKEKASEATSLLEALFLTLPPPTKIGSIRNVK